ncbi:MAG: aminotransferase class III-fold pyridoxal phosphate-dependent enzyme, partial [Gammaproteobacteria bacterium]|nr:aminotransferase class III-fold pyridoxal phosphate-dependent enzyme [Gammaproteobacteria bacterium]
NPLACSAALTSIQILLESDWQANIRRIQTQLEIGLAPCRDLEQVSDVRVLGAIGVVEMKQTVNMKTITAAFVKAGVWVRPFGKLVYLMPPFIINHDDLETLTRSVVNVVQQHRF